MKFITLALLLLGSVLSPYALCAQTDKPDAAYPLPALPTTAGIWQPGVDYVVILPPNETKVAPGKVELLVRFLYTGSVYREMENQLKNWKKPDYIEIVHRPAIKWPHARVFAQMFLTLEKLGRADDLHLKLYDWIWDPKRYPIYHTINRPDVEGINRLNIEFAMANGIDEKKFKDVYFSEEIHNKVVSEAVRSHDDGALIVVNGRYGTDSLRAVRGITDKYGTPESYTRLLQLIEYLAASERQRMSNDTAVKR